MASKKTWTWIPPTEGLAKELEKTGGSLMEGVPGTVHRREYHATWDMSKEWAGSELVCFKIVRSNWGNSVNVHYYTTRMPPGINPFASFTLRLDKNLSDEEINQLAEVYMMALNLRRVEGE